MSSLLRRWKESSLKDKLTYLAGGTLAVGIVSFVAFTSAISLTHTSSYHPNYTHISVVPVSVEAIPTNERYSDLSTLLETASAERILCSLEGETGDVVDASALLRGAMKDTKPLDLTVFYIGKDCKIKEVDGYGRTVSFKDWY